MTVGKVRTVLGDIDPKEMGYTLAHEHILTHPQGGGEKDEQDHFLDDYSKAVEMCEAFKSNGGGTLIEATPKTWGRDVPGMAQVSRDTGVHVVACTGWMNQGSGMTSWEDTLSVQDMYDISYKEATEGMDDTKILPGWVKCGASYNHITPNEEKAIRSGANVAKETGLVFHSHTSTGTMGMEILDLVAEEGLELDRMILAHIDRFPDLWYHRKLLERGAYLIYDGPGKAKYYPDQLRVDLLKQLVADGFEDQIMLSNDMGRRSHHLVYGGGPGFNFIKDKFIPRLIEEGLSEEVVHKFMYENPAKAYTMVK